MTIPSSWSINRCCINHSFFTNCKFAAIPCCVLSHNLNRIFSRDSDVRSTKVSCSIFNYNSIVFNAHWWTICIWVPSSTNGVAIFIFSFYCKGTRFIPTIYIGSTRPVVKGVQSDNRIVLCQIKLIAITIIEFNIYSNFNWFILVCWSTDCHSNSWVRTNSCNSFAIIWWET